ncbi:hypothetical protein B0A54_08951 [Friedmanniomyces endolithicus]|uniref:Chloride channel protein n=1 Tax=Friedmanniomyces endolithicus TaxID=329885 RepID=A0A4U0UWM8_9PEZI|nr:hypothetical protein B0A54_08951 [Friedmanniomyces endolithicus]
MPKSVASTRSYQSYASDYIPPTDDEVGELEEEASRNAYRNTLRSRTASVSPVNARVHTSSRTSDVDLSSRLPSRLLIADEGTGLLSRAGGTPTHSGYRTLPTSVPSTPRFPLSRQYSQLNTSRLLRNHSRRGSFGLRLARALGTDAVQAEEQDVETSGPSLYRDDRVWYDQFTSTDWVHDSIADAYRVKELRSRKDFRGRIQAVFDGAQGWLVVAVIGIVTAGFAYVIDVTEATIFDYKTGYCSTRWWYSKRKCCHGASICSDWARWSGLIHEEGNDKLWTNFAAYLIWVVALAMLACLITLQTRTVVSSAISLSTLDENLGADHHRKDAKSDTEGRRVSMSPTRHFREAAQRPPVVYYPAAGSGVAEVKVILSGFVLHGYLGVKTLMCKSIGLIFSVASGLSLGKEGPYVHIATCIGNIACRLVPKYRANDGKRREVLSASAGAGVAVAFGAPIGGTLFSLEEASYYHQPKVLFRTFFCCIAAALSLKVWAQTFRKISVIKKYPLVEVLLVALVTGIVSFWNRYTRLPVAELLYELAAPCNAFTEDGTGLCPTQERIPDIIVYLCVAFVIKFALTVITFGVKVPAGVYLPSMILGGILGRIVGHAVQHFTLRYPNFFLFANCPHDGNPESCVVPGVYALVAAGATMCGVTRLSVTLAVILFELTGSLEHVLPFSLGILIAKWTADAVEPRSIYDLLTDMNAYPYLDAKARPIFTTELRDITHPPNRNRFVDITSSPLVPAKQLRSKLEYAHMAGELDGGLPILRDGILVGLIPAPDLEYALDRLESEDGALCLMSTQERWQGPGSGVSGRPETDAPAEGERFMTDDPPQLQRPSATDPTDFTPYIDSRARGAGHLQSDGFGFRVLRQAGSAVYLRLEGGKVRRAGA